MDKPHVRKGYEHGFTIVNNQLIKDTRLKPETRFLFILLASKPDNWEFYQNPLCKELGWSPDTFRKHMGILEKHGYIEREQVRDKNGKFSHYNYVLLYPPVSEKSGVGKSPGRKLSGSVNLGPTNKDLDKEKPITKEDEEKLPAQKNEEPPVKTEKKEELKVAPKKEFTSEEVQEWDGLKKALRQLGQDSPGERIAAWKIYEQHIRGEYFLSSWEYLSDHSPIEPHEVMKEWVMKGGWYDVTEAKYNKIGNWIKVQFKIKKEDQKNGSNQKQLIDEETLRRIDAELAADGY